MIDPFDSPFQLLDWAKMHVGELAGITRSYFDQKPIAFVSHDNEETGIRYVNIKLLKPIPVEISLLAFDAINGARAALDQVMYASTVALKRSTENTKFPFGNKTLESVRADLKRRPHNMHPDIVEMAVSAAAWEGGNRILWEMNKLRNLKHHRFIAPRAGRPATMTMSGNGMGLKFPRSVWNEETQEMTFLEISGFFEGKLQAEVDAVFAAGAPFSGQPVIEVFNQILNVSHGIIVAIKAETERLQRSQA